MNEMRERFENAKAGFLQFDKASGSRWLDEDNLLAFIEAETTRAGENMRQRCEGVMPERSEDYKEEHPEEYLDCCGDGETNGWNAYRTAALKAIESLGAKEAGV